MKNTRLWTAIPLALASTLLCLAQSSTAPAPVTSRFVGTWKENEAKRSLRLSPVLKFQQNADGGTEEVRGGPTPVTQPVRFDGKPYDIGSGNTIVWKQAGRSQFERQLFSAGRLTATRKIQISNGGKTLTEETERKQPDGKTTLITSVYSRVSGAGFELPGIWSLQSRQSDNPAQVTLSVAGINSLRYVNSQGVTYTAALDNKPVPVTGPGVIEGSMIALIRQIDDYTITSTLSRNGVVTGTGTITVSPDGKIMTTTVTTAGPNANTTPSVRVWEKQ